MVGKHPIAPVQLGAPNQVKQIATLQLGKFGNVGRTQTIRSQVNHPCTVGQSTSQLGPLTVMQLPPVQLIAPIIVGQWPPAGQLGVPTDVGQWPKGGQLGSQAIVGGQKPPRQLTPVHEVGSQVGPVKVGCSQVGAPVQVDDP